MVAATGVEESISLHCYSHHLDHSYIVWKCKELRCLEVSWQVEGGNGGHGPCLAMVKLEKCLHRVLFHLLASACGQ